MAELGSVYFYFDI